MSTLPSLSVSLPPDFADTLSTTLRLALERSGWRFSYENDEFTAEEVTAPDGLLPMWVHQGQAIMRQSMGGNAGDMAFRLNGQALCGVVPEPQEGTASLPIWACYVHFAIEQWRERHMELVKKGEPIPLDDLFQNWRSLVQANQVKLLAPAPVVQPGLSTLGHSLPVNPSSESAG